MSRGAIRIVSASAGTGKTTRLSQEVLRAVQSGVPASSIVATTFTNKAADELEERIRLVLLADGRRDAAESLRDARRGTMNSVFGQLLVDFAFDLGISPVQQVIPETEVGPLFETALSAAVEAHGDSLDPVMGRLGIAEWTAVVRTLVDLARSNNLAPSAMAAMAERSWATYERWLPSPLAAAQEANLDRALSDALREALTALPPDSTVKKARDGRARIQQALQDVRHGPLPWSEWAALAKLDVGKAAEHAAAGVVRAASRHAEHPRLHRDLAAAIRGIFQVAADAETAYDDLKRQRGLVDFVDQEALALSLLAEPRVRAELQQAVDLVLVDEVQDSSPLEVALIRQLADLARQSIWVGDPKQAIYGFRGTDPSLMAAILRDLQSRDVADILSTSYRFRPQLAAWTNAVFEPAFARFGLEAERIRLEAALTEKGQPPALAVWRLDGTTQAARVEALAEAVSSLLQNPGTWPVVDLKTHELRPVRPGDVAILCRRNDECAALAGALAARGITAATGQGGLLSTPEAITGVAALRYLVDASDTLALAELLHYGPRPWGDGAFLETWLRQPAGGPPPPELTERLDGRFQPARVKLSTWTPSEALDAAMGAADVTERVLAWGHERQRLANLHRLRQLAVEYEALAASQGGAATAAGLVLFFAQAAHDPHVWNVQAEGSAETVVTVMTYHKSKGLEWPVVILAGLDSTRPASPFHPLAFTEGGVDAADPLRGRTLHYWPWPYGSTKTEVVLDALVRDTPEWRRTMEQEDAEEVRRLYVGMTRPRDYLVISLAVRTKGSRLGQLQDAAGMPLIHLPDAPEDALTVAGVPFPARVLRFGGDRPPEESRAHDPVAVYGPKLPSGEVGRPTYPPAVVRPSAAVLNSAAPAAVFRVARLGERLPMAGTADMALLGDVVHAFLAADPVEAARGEREALAAAILERWQLHVFRPEDLVMATDRLAAFLRRRYRVRATYREWPVYREHGGQTMRGYIDWLVDTDTGWVIVDHKSFPGRESLWQQHAAAYQPQLALYAQAVTHATGRPVHAALIHLPVVGAILELAEGFEGVELWGARGEPSG